MSIREEQCNKVCRILDDVLANRTTERDSLIVAVRKAFESLEQFGNAEQLPSTQPEIIRCRNCKFASGDSRICMQFGHSPIGELDFCAWAERRTDE
jgi:hypothetical protein